MRLHLFILTALLSLGAASPAQSQSPELPFSNDILEGIPLDHAHIIYFGTKYLGTETKDIDESIRDKAAQISLYIGRKVPIGPKPENESLSDYMNKKKEVLYQQFSDRSSLLASLTKSASRLDGRDGHLAAAHIYDLVISINKYQVEAAYELEKLLITKAVDQDWKKAENDKLASNQAKTATEKKETLQSPSKGVFEVDFTKIGMAGGGSSFDGIARNQSLIKGLLVQELSGSQFAGEASQMNATVVGKKDDGSKMNVKFNQKVGKMMTDAIDYMMSYLETRHKALPSGLQVELSFEEQYIPKDGPSAGVACTLMLESILKGYEYSPGFAVTGAMDDAGIVGGVGGVDGKIRGAITRRCEVVAIPSENESVISDMLLIEGPATLAKIQIVEIETFEDALEIAKKHSNREPEIKQAVETFNQIQTVLNRPGGLNSLNNFKVQGKLREVLKAMPNHLSAKYLLLKAIHREPTSLTLMGSVRAIDQHAAPMINALQEGDFKVEDKFAKDNFGKTMSAMKRLRPLLDDRTRPCADAIAKYSGYVRTAINNPPRSNGAIRELINNMRSSGRDVGTQYDRLFQRPDVRRELMIDDDDE